MSESDQILARREAVRELYGVLYDEVARILFLHDPMGIAFETKTDEYESAGATCLANRPLPGLRDFDFGYLADQLYREGQGRTVSCFEFASAGIMAHPTDT